MTDVMRAACAVAYGGPEVVTIREVPRPEPGPGEIQIRVRAAAVNSGDWRIRSGDVPRGFGLMVRLAFGWSRPRQPIFGWECAGEVAAIGSGVSGFVPGEQVIAWPNGPRGCHAEYMTLKADRPIIPKPACLSWEEAGAFCFGGVTALTFLRRGGIGPGKRLMVIGASGTVGTAAVQIARAAGAHVTAVCSPRNHALVLGLGAEQVLDYRNGDHRRSGDHWDIVMDNAGSETWATVRPLLNPGGRFLQVVGALTDLLRALPTRWSREKVIFGDAGGTRADLEQLARLAEAGAYRPVLDAVMPLAEARAAHARVESRRKCGSVVLTMG